MKRPIRGIILDVEGTLVDSNSAHAHSWFEALRENGLDPGMAAIRAHIGTGADRFLPSVTGIAVHSPAGLKITDDQKRIFHEKYLATVRPFRCADALVSTLLQTGLRVVIASPSSEEELEPLVRRVGPATASVDRITKAAPDLIALALERLGFYPIEVFMIGDSPFDIEAALKLGVRTVIFRSGGFPDEQIEAATAIYDHPQQLLENFETSPLASALLTRSA